MHEIYTKDSLIKRLQEIREMGWIKGVKSRKNSGSVGNTLETLLGIQENNLPLPNAAEWELKTQRMETSSLLTLFHMEPSPRALNIVPWLLVNYGWSHREAGKKYPENERSFRQTLCCGKRSPRGFAVSVEEESRRISIDFSFEDISEEFSDWKRSILERNSIIMNPSYTPYWGWDDLFHKAGVKLGNCFYVIAETKRVKRAEYFHYVSVKLLSHFSFEKFLNLLRNGRVFIDFDARTGHNHGTKFRIRQSDVENLYDIAITL